MGIPPDVPLPEQNENQEQPENSKRVRHAVPSQLSTSRIKRVFDQGPVNRLERVPESLHSDF
jgi:hypothetical protein